MRNTPSPLFAACCLVAIWLCVPVAVRAEAGMYRVELMIVAYPAGSGAEQWEALPELAYPQRTRSLVDPRTPSGISRRGDDPAIIEPDGDGLVAPPLATQGQSTAFHLLPAAEREWAAGAASLQRSGHSRILFHEAWYQPLYGQAAAIPVALDRSGEGSAWPELQGTVTLYQSGDYVLETNLWLNTQGDYLPGDWRMPPPPRGPASPGFAPLRDAGLSAQDTDSPLQEAPEVASDYPYRHAVLLRQTRRIRAGVSYYIDHPLLGVVVKVTAPEDTHTPPAGTADSAQPAGPSP